MANRTIGTVARETGLPVRTIRFYEAEGVLPPVERAPSGYRQYSAQDVRRLRLIRDARLLGLPLTEIRTLVEQAFASDCATFVPQLTALIAAQRAEIGARIEALQRLSGELGELETHVLHAPCADEPGLMVTDCDYCLPIESEERRT